MKSKPLWTWIAGLGQFVHILKAGDKKKWDASQCGLCVHGNEVAGETACALWVMSGSSA